MTAQAWVLLVAVVLLGATVGSFLNVVIYRLPAGTFLSAGARSVCANPDCRKPIRWYDNVPVLGWLLLRGRARCCGYRIPVRYPLVEALTALLFGLLWLLAPAGPVLRGGEIDSRAAAAFLLQAFFLANLVANAFIDIDHRILPDALTKPAMAVGLLGSLLVPGLAGRLDLTGVSPAADSLLCSGLGLVTGLGATQAVRVLAQVAFRKEAMGFGDVKLMGAIGAFLGWQGVLLTFFLGCVLGAGGGMVHRWRTGDAYIYFGPFLALGAVITLLAGDVLVSAFDAMQRWQRTSPASPWVAAVTGMACVVMLVVLIRRGRRS